MILKDEKLGNFEVHHDGSNYSVIEKTGLNKKNEQIIKTHAYCSSMPNAINAIIKLQVEGKNDEYDLKSYAKSLNEASKRIEKLLI